MYHTRMNTFSRAFLFALGTTLSPGSHAQSQKEADQSQWIQTVCHRDVVGTIQNVKDHVFAHLGKGSDGKFWFTVCDHGEAVMRVLASPGKPKSGRWSYTPTGEFFIGDKQRMRHSASYGNAPMPFSQHLYKGIFIHAGQVTGYPISHGCIRLDAQSAEEFFRRSYRGMRVIIEDTVPQKSKKPS